jgi:hypothetical protein
MRAIVVGPWWQRARASIRAAAHRWRGCLCRVLSTDDGIGGQCIECGRIYGWMTCDEIGRTLIPMRGGAPFVLERKP